MGQLWMFLDALVMVKSDIPLEQHLGQDRHLFVQDLMTSWLAIKSFNYREFFASVEDDAVEDDAVEDDAVTHGSVEEGAEAITQGTSRKHKSEGKKFHWLTSTHDLLQDKLIFGSIYGSHVG